MTVAQVAKENHASTKSMPLLKNSFPFSIYSPLDSAIIALSGQYRVPLTGGTALEILVSHTRLPVSRPRSINDIDFICFRQPSADRLSFQNALRELGLQVRDENPFSIHFAAAEVEADILLSADDRFGQFYLRLGSYLLLDEVGQLLMKLDRFVSANSANKIQDKTDLLILLRLIGQANRVEELEDFLELWNYDELYFNALNALIQQVTIGK